MVTVDFGRLDLTPGGRVLDIGCGSGRHATAAYRLPRARVVGVDLAFLELVAAKGRLELHDRLGEHGGGQWGVCQADGLHLPFGAGRFDLVVCSEVLEHMPDPGQAVAEAARVLKPGGHLVVSVPRRWPERICWALSRGYATAEGGHVRIFRKTELVVLLEHGGLTAGCVHYAHSLHTPFWWLKCLIGLKRENVWPVRLYHRFLTWDILRKPRLTRFLEQLLNPVLGKSLVVYLRKNVGQARRVSTDPLENPEGAHKRVPLEQARAEGQAADLVRRLAALRGVREDVVENKKATGHHVR